jgi:hypothetical protein
MILLAALWAIKDHDHYIKYNNMRWDNTGAWNNINVDYTVQHIKAM